jgi:hypothetical protein
MVTYDEVDEFSSEQWNRLRSLVLPKRTEPPKREWVGLTDEEIGRLTVFEGLHHVEIPLLADFIRAIEAALKEKNT